MNIWNPDNYNIYFVLLICSIIYRALTLTLDFSGGFYGKGNGARKAHIIITPQYSEQDERSHQSNAVLRCQVCQVKLTPTCQIGGNQKLPLVDVRDGAGGNFFHDNGNPVWILPSDLLRLLTPAVCQMGIVS
jgi:hypothetical protein